MNLKNLVTKYIYSKEAKEEKAMLQDWKQESEANLTAFKSYVDDAKLSEGLTDYQQVDRVKAWENIQQRTGIESTPVRKIWPLKQIAAIFLILIAALFTFNLISSEKTPASGVLTYTKPAKISLQDKSLVTLDIESKLIENKTRSVTLDGRAYFDIAPNPNEPFTVALHHGIVTVLGTEFNIATSAEFTQIFVTEGKVKYQFENEDVILKVGDLVTIENGKMTKTSRPDYLPNMWTNKILKFENHSLHHVLENIAIYYNVKIVFPNNVKSDECKINTTFKDETLQDVLKELQVISGLQYSLIDKKIIVESFKC